MSDLLKRVAAAEMEAYDRLPSRVRRVFDRAPRKVSVVQTMGLPGVKKAYANMPVGQFASVLESHLMAQATGEAVVST